MSELKPKFKSQFYYPVYHLWDTVTIKDGRPVLKSEVRVRKVALGEDSEDEIFLSREADGSRWFLKLEGKCEKFNAFKDAIVAYCQQNPIFCDPEGYVMDGYARWFVCVKAGLIPKVEIAGGNLADDEAKITWIRSQKLARHHLNETQRMLIVQAEIRAHPERTESWTAELLGVSRTTVVKYREQMERAGTLTAITKLIGKDGREYGYTPKAPLTPEQQSKLEEQRRNKADQAAWEKAKTKFADKVLFEGKIGSSLKNIRTFLQETASDKFEGYNEQVESLKATLNKLSPPIHDTNLEREQIGTSLKKIAGFFKDAEAVPSYHQATLLEIRQVIDQLLSPEPATTTPVGATFTTLWNVQTVPLTETKTGLSIKLRPAYAPDKVDVLEGVKPGPVLFGGKLINFQSFKGLLMLPAKPEDATVEAPREDDLRMERGTVDPGSAVG